MPAILLVGCSFDMNRQRQDSNGTVDTTTPPVDIAADGPKDLGGEGPLGWDGPHHDQASGEASPPDVAPDRPLFADGEPKVDAPWIGEGGPPPVDMACFDPESVVCKNCQSTCQATPDNPDGDGLVDPYDPKPTQCNALFWSDDFADAPQGSYFWTVTGIVSWSCGKVDFGASAGISLNNPATLAITGDYLVEARFTLGVISASGWIVALTAGAQVTCALTDQNTSAIPSVVMYQDSTCTNPSPVSMALPPIAPSDPVTLRLYRQTSGTATTYTCQLIHPSGTVLSPGSFTAPACPPDAIQISTANRGINLDWFHAFDLN
jgi:hypothetical protein